ncbi:MAG: GDP-fucose synthetase [Caldithrix sp. RBG_13_44_9]|nr:MAG: GDP-fucose synthetase [Caldithrix sp. RBG_13_44_9]
MNNTSKIYIAGHNGMVGSAIVRRLQVDGFNNLLLRNIDQLNLVDQKEVEKFFKKEKPEYVFLAAAKVGGILANNTYRAQFIYENIQIQNNVIHFAWKYGVKKLLFLGSSCIYPKLAPQPMKEEHLLTGQLEPTNEPYAIAKIAGIKMCQAYHAQYGCNFISVMPTNLYGPNDNYNLETSHVLPALIRKMHLGKCLELDNWDALRLDLDKRPIDGVNGRTTQEEIVNVLGKYGIHSKSWQSAVGSLQKAGNIANRQLPTTNLENKNRSDESTANCQLPTVITLWGTGTPRREFLFVNDLAEACFFLMQNYDSGEIINIGVGEDLSIKELAMRIKDIVGFQGELQWDSSKPDGTPRKLLDVYRLHSLGWKAKISLSEGIKKTYEWYID